MSQSLAQKTSVIQFLGHLIKGNKKVLVPLTYAEETELSLFYKVPDMDHLCYIENNYCRFGIMESLRRKGYIYQVKETQRCVYYRLSPEHQI